MRTAAALLTLCFLASSAATAAEDGAAQRRSVSVTGQGEISVRPDRARLNLGVDQFAQEPRPAELATNRIVRAYLAELKKLGIEDKHVSTAGISLNPEYVWDEKLRQNRITGYRAHRDIQIVVEDLDKIGDLILSATQVGVNQVSPPMLESSQGKDLSRKALVKAAEDARGKAQLLAETLGAKLGAVHSVSASDGGAPPPVMYKVMAMRAEAAGDANAEMGFSAGEIKVTATVNADFDLLSP